VQEYALIDLLLSYHAAHVEAFYFRIPKLGYFLQVSNPTYEKLKLRHVVFYGSL